MESWRWRYHPEFRIQLLVDGQPENSAFSLVADTFGNNAFNNYGLVAKPYDGGIVCHQLQKPDGVNWIPAVDLTSPVRFIFWLLPKAGTDISELTFFSSAATTFGRPALYVNNLDTNGNIDANIAGSVVSLTTGISAGNTERASISTPVVGAEITPADFTEIRAGQIDAGSPVSFTESRPILNTDTHASIDFSILPQGAWFVELVGGSPVSEPVVIDQRFAGCKAIGYIVVYREEWLTPVQPREYQLNFST